MFSNGGGNIVTYSLGCAPIQEFIRIKAFVAVRKQEFVSENGYAILVGVCPSIKQAEKMAAIKNGLRRWAPSIVLMTVIFIASGTPGKEIPGFGVLDTILKKGAHMAGYALLAISYLYAIADSGMAKRRIIVMAIVLAGLYAVTDEFHQSFTPGRNPSVADVGIDAVGAIIGTLIWSRIKVPLKKHGLNITGRLLRRE